MWHIEGSAAFVWNAVTHIPVAAKKQAGVRYLEPFDRLCRHIPLSSHLARMYGQAGLDSDNGSHSMYYICYKRA
jgi:hypothetical protein